MGPQHCTMARCNARQRLRDSNPKSRPLVDRVRVTGSTMSLRPEHLFYITSTATALVLIVILQLLARECWRYCRSPADIIYIDLLEDAARTTLALQRNESGKWIRMSGHWDGNVDPFFNRLHDVGIPESVVERWKLKVALNTLPDDSQANYLRTKALKRFGFAAE